MEEANLRAGQSESVPEASRGARRNPPVEHRALRVRALTVIAAIVTIAIVDHAYAALFFRGDFAFPGFVAEPKVGLIRYVSWGIALIPLLWMPLAVERPSELLLWGLYLMVIMPTGVVANYSFLTYWQAVLMLLVMCVGMLWLRLFQYLPLLRIRRIRLSRVAFWSALLVISVVFNGLVLREYGATMRLVGIEEVYQQRAIWAGAPAGFLVSYAQSWQAGVINVFLLAYGVYFRRWSLVILGLAGELFLFAVAAQRILLFVPVMMAGVWLLGRQPGYRFAPLAVGGVGTLYGIASILPVDSSPLARLFAQFTLHRLVTNNGVLSTLYFDFFRSNPQVMFSEVKPLNAILQSPYTINYKEAMGWHYWGFVNDPNANLMADGYAQLGYTGVLIECAILGIAFWILDSVARSSSLPRRFVLLCLTMQIASVANGQIPNMLLGGGFALTVLLLYVIPTRATVRVASVHP